MSSGPNLSRNSSTDFVSASSAGPASICSRVDSIAMSLPSLSVLVSRTSNQRVGVRLQLFEGRPARRRRSSICRCISSKCSPISTTFFDDFFAGFDDFLEALDGRLDRFRMISAPMVIAPEIAPDTMPVDAAKVISELLPESRIRLYRSCASASASLACATLRCAASTDARPAAS